MPEFHVSRGVLAGVRYLFSPSINGLLYFALLDRIFDIGHYSRADAQHEYASRSHFYRRRILYVCRL